MTYRMRFALILWMEASVVPRYSGLQYHRVSTSIIPMYSNPVAGSKCGNTKSLH
jgi:hypothetical protein